MEKRKIKCLQCGKEQDFLGASKDDFGWHTVCKGCEGSFDIDIENYIVPNDTKVLMSGNRLGTIQGNDEEITDEFENINYYVVPNGKTFDEEEMFLVDEFEIIE